MDGRQRQVRRSAGKFLIGAMLFGTAGTVVTFAPSQATASTLGIVRLFGGAIVLYLLIPLFRGNQRAAFSLLKRPMIWIMAISSAAYQPLFFAATERNGVAFSTLIAVGCIPLFAGILGRIFLKEKLSIAWMAATLLAIIGLVIRSWGELTIEDPAGLVMAVLAGFSVGCYVNAAKVQLSRGTHQFEMMSMTYLLGTIFLLPLLKDQSLAWVISPRGFLLALYLGIVTMAIANSLQISGLRALPPGPAATLMLADPLTATLLGVLILREDLTLTATFGLLLVSVALIWQSLATQSSRN